MDDLFSWRSRHILRKKVNHKGAHELKDNAIGGYTGSVNFGSPEMLREISLKRGVLEFTRSLAGVTQKHTGQSTAEKKIESAFTDYKKTFARQAENVVAEKGM